MKTVEEILKEEENLREAKKLYYCLCYAATGTVCTVCKVHMDMDDSPYASCEPTCKIACMSKSQLIELSHSRQGKSKGTDKGNKFVTFTRKSNEEDDYIKLFSVLSYLKKCKSIEQFWYSFEYQQNGNPHLHTIIHMKKGKYFRDISRMLKVKIEHEEKLGHMDEQNQKGSDEEAQKYLFKDIEKTAQYILENNVNYFLLYNIKLNSK